MNNFQADEIRKSLLYIQEKLDMLNSKEAIKKIVLQDNSSLISKVLHYLKLKR